VLLTISCLQSTTVYFVIVIFIRLKDLRDERIRDLQKSQILTIHTTLTTRKHFRNVCIFTDCWQFFLAKPLSKQIINEFPGNQPFLTTLKKTTFTYKILNF